MWRGCDQRLVNRVRRGHQPQQTLTGGVVTVVRMRAQRLTQHDPHEVQLLSKRAEAAIMRALLVGEVERPFARHQVNRARGAGFDTCAARRVLAGH